MKPFLAFTLGDPAGIGPWVSVAAARDRAVRRLCRPVLVGDASVIKTFFRDARLRVRAIADLADYADRPSAVNVLHVAHPGSASLRLGAPQRVGGEAAALAIRTAAALAMQRRVAGVVTGPVSKESFKLAGLPFPGHTEMLAALSGVKRVEMVMAAGRLVTVLLTRHIPLKDVSARLRRDDIASSVRFVDPWLRRVLGLTRPVRWAVCGFNPHAGDNGLLGREELRVVGPAVRALRARGIDAAGPLPADVAWSKHAAGLYDAVASLYHDQGMIPLKTLHPRTLVNITVGLPWIRTSPGHGTAYDLAAQGYRRADPAATIEAAKWALKIARSQERGAYA